MTKYDFFLDMTTDNTLSVMLNRIKINSDVLEFGPANGRMTKYMKEILNCKIDIVEIDEIAASQASKHSQTSFVGNDEGDIEKYHWVNIDKKYDFIIFADVLEHLRNPKKVLENCKQLLKDEGKILISIPNIAHNSIIISLINNDFSYSKTGLLDNTHVHFFTDRTFCKMVSELGYSIEFEKIILSRVGDNEILYNYFNVGRNIKKELRRREKGSAYQYVYEISKVTGEDFTLPSLGDDSTNYYYDFYENYECEIYLKNELQDDFEFAYKTSKIYSTENKEKVVINLFFDEFEGFSELRIDPLDKNCVLCLLNVIVTDIHNVDFKLTTKKTNANYELNELYYFNHDDPQLYFDISNILIKSVTIEFELIDYEFDDFEKYGKIFDLFSVGNDKNLYEHLKFLDNSLSEKQKTIDLLESIVKHRDKDISELWNAINQRDEDVKLMNNFIQCREEDISDLKSTIHENNIAINEYIEKNKDFQNDILELVQERNVLNGKLEKYNNWVFKLFKKQT